MTVRRVAFFTGSRAEYGLLAPVLDAVDADSRLAAQLIVGGAHFDAEYGNTCREIEADGRPIDWHIRSSAGSTSRLSAAVLIAETIAGVSGGLERLKPDFLVVYGDRSESFGAMIAATQSAVVSAHIEGGDYTEGGALDDSVRHAMTKLAHLHFTTNLASRERVLRLGEEPWRVHNVGLPSLDAVRAGKFTPPDAIARDLALDPGRPLILFCQHSVATEADRAAEQVRPALAVLKELADRGAQVLITYPNSDAGGLAIIEEIGRIASSPAIRVVPHLGRLRFHGVLNMIGRLGRGALVGNTSAGIKETPAFGCPAVNVGSRQQGRLRASNVLDTGYGTDEIRAAVLRCIDDADFRARCASCENPYGDGHSGERIASVLATVERDETLIRKKMTF